MGSWGCTVLFSLLWDMCDVVHRRIFLNRRDIKVRRKDSSCRDVI